MQPSSKHPPAVTLIEMLVVLTVLGIALTFALDSLTKNRTHARFEAAIEETVTLIQSTRNKSFSLLEMDIVGIPYTADGYYLSFDSSTQTLELYADITDATVSDQLLDSASIHEDLAVSVVPADLEQIYYQTPLGEVLFITTSDPTGTANSEITLTIETYDGIFSQDITIQQLSGYPELIN